jgi:hypothetical protein
MQSQAAKNNSRSRSRSGRLTLALFIDANFIAESRGIRRIKQRATKPFHHENTSPSWPQRPIKNAQEDETTWPRLRHKAAAPSLLSR